MRCESNKLQTGYRSTSSERFDIGNLVTGRISHPQDSVRFLHMLNSIIFLGRAVDARFLHHVSDRVIIS